MKTGEIVLFSAVTALAVALVLSVKKVDEEPQYAPRPPIIIEEI
jgi:hypothetical protein